uniref:Uncharacterized protein C7orf26 homolog n=1 Tax=Cacopsylla melanoneura TaxID=428564 RepID=A0A8D8SVM0_9HEMI
MSSKTSAIITPDTKNVLKKMNFPDSAREVLNKIEQLCIAQNAHRTQSSQHIKQMELAMEMISEFIFRENTNKSFKKKMHSVQTLSKIQELQLLEMLCEYMSSLHEHSPSQVVKNAVYMFLFPHSHAHRSRLLVKLVSMAISTSNYQVLISTGILVQQVGCTTKFSTDIAEGLVSDYFILLPHAVTKLAELPLHAPLFTANLLTSLSEMYNKSNINPNLLSIVTEWLSKHPDLCYTALVTNLQSSLPSGAIPMPASTPFVGLFKWCILAPFYIGQSASSHSGAHSANGGHKSSSACSGADGAKICSSSFNAQSNTCATNCSHSHASSTNKCSTNNTNNSSTNCGNTHRNTNMTNCSKPCNTNTCGATNSSSKSCTNSSNSNHTNTNACNNSHSGSSCSQTSNTSSCTGSSGANSRGSCSQNGTTSSSSCPASNQGEGSTESVSQLYSKLHLSLLTSLLECKTYCTLSTQRNIISADALCTIVSYLLILIGENQAAAKPEGKSSTTISSESPNSPESTKPTTSIDEVIAESIHRLAQFIQVSVFTGTLFGNKTKLLAQLSLLPPNKLMSCVFENVVR